LTPDINTTRLDNGVTIISCTLPTAHSTSLGVWILNGGRHQTPTQTGYAHLLEHMLFKGTATHSALGLARRFEAMGGQINAHTGRELTALHGLVPKQYIYELLGLFSEMLTHPRFDEQDMGIEREVVLQEVAMIADTPEEAIEETAVERVWPDHPLGWPILGREAVIENATSAALHTYLRDLLTGGRLWVVAAGAVDHAALIHACSPLAHLPTGERPPSWAPRFQAGHDRAQQDLAQSHLVWAMNAPALTDNAHYPALVVANHLLGGGASSRLFQEIREQRGLAYSIQSRLDLYSDSGLWMIQTACEPGRVDECRRAVEDALQQLMRDGPAADELEISRDHLRASMLIAEDDPEECMERLAREAIYQQHHWSMEERLAQLTAVTPQDIKDVLTQAWAQTLHLEWSPK
jgi:predicted Zn-dependent peptidase